MIGESKPVEYWRAITPESLIAPIQHVRTQFDEGAWKCSEVTEKLCFANLHPDESPGDLRPYQSAFLDYRKIVGVKAAHEFDNALQIGTPSAIFHAFLGIYSVGVQSEIRRLFSDVLQMGIAHSETLKEHPAEWAKAHLSLLLKDEGHAVRRWIKSVCDKQDYSGLTLTSENAEDFIFWTDWRAPKLIYMKPSGNLPYDPATAWAREDAATTNRLLQSLSSRFIQFLGFRLDKLAGNAHVELAKRGRNAAAVNANVSFWRDIHADFRALADEERTYSPRNAVDTWLLASVSYENPNASYGDWTVYRGVDEQFKARFEVLATRAGKTLDPNAAVRPLHRWLHHLFTDLLEHDSKFLFAAERGVGGIIKSVCAASATYAARLEVNALESSEGGSKLNIPGYRERREQKDRPNETLPVSQPEENSTPHDKDETNGPPVAFLSYSWDSAAHKEWVLELASRLRENGVKVILDRWHLIPGQDKLRFMEKSIAESDFVVLVCHSELCRTGKHAGGRSRL